jgi:2-phospho-L-lactate guanylyltransferase
MAQALVPLKDLVQAKTRLAGLLSPSQRRALAQAMMEDVLAVLACHPQIEGITLLSDDPCAHLLAARYGAVHWPESELGARGLNAVVRAASARLLASQAQTVLLVHADLPALSPADICAVLTARRARPGLVVGCDRHGTGTNLLCFDAGSVPDFCFGALSCAGHTAAARARGVPVTVLRRAGIGLDVDEPRDLALLLRQLEGHGAGRTSALIRDTELGARISLALASLALQDMPGDREEVY